MNFNPFNRKPKLLVGPGSESQTSVLIKLASDPQFPVDKLRELIALKNQEEDRACEKEFDRNFAMMQAEFPILPRSKKGHVGNKYCPLEVMVKLCRPIIAKYGFSYSWDQLDIPEHPDKKLITLTISGHGWKRKHPIESYVENPKQSREGKSVTNRNQELGSTDTYGHRYTFKAGFGLAEDDEDLDGYVPPASKGTVYSDAEVVSDEGSEGTPPVGKSKKVDGTLSELYVQSMHGLQALPKEFKPVAAMIGSIINRPTCKESAENLAIVIEKLRKPTGEPAQFVADLQAALKL